MTVVVTDYFPYSRLNTWTSFAAAKFLNDIHSVIVIVRVVRTVGRNWWVI